MRQIGLLVFAAALVAGPALAQSETELYEGGGTALLAAQREVTQRNIDMATQALRAKDYKTARKYAQSVTRADPKRIESWLMLGAAQQGLADWKGARATYTRAVRMVPSHPEARAGLGVAYARTADPKATVQLASRGRGPVGNRRAGRHRGAGVSAGRTRLAPTSHERPRLSRCLSPRRERRARPRGC